MTVDDVFKCLSTQNCFEKHPNTHYASDAPGKVQGVHSLQNSCLVAETVVRKAKAIVDTYRLFMHFFTSRRKQNCFWLPIEWIITIIITIIIIINIVDIIIVIIVTFVIILIIIARK